MQILKRNSIWKKIKFQNCNTSESSDSWTACDNYYLKFQKETNFSEPVDSLKSVFLGSALTVENLRIIQN